MELAQEFSAQGISVAVSIMRSRKARNSDRLEAVKIILDRGHGKPKQDIDLRGSLTLEQLVAASFRKDEPATG